MTEPHPAEEFLELLLQSEEVASACRAELGEKASDAIDRARKGDATDFLEWFEDWRSNNPEEETAIEGAAPDDDVFNICINRTGPLFWIQANEFEDICYFGSRADAVSYAEMEFSAFIDALNEREDDEED
jgi:hypothetical protein